ncbi:hypothetical protein E2562_000879 [Oryza meyeriana var. granulata]|uniref:Uncharacterized protein n=1 Tax=Oryza meyeriana var. granulata TaxID=110450 RepID=A0A6G1CWV4_9ORYZ|nr:hypothetical protein E2562_000879 [Oryza meyeriana var. granulata]
MLESQAVVGNSDMLQAMQRDALRLAGKALDDFEAVDSTKIARFIKKDSSPPRLLHLLRHRQPGDPAVQGPSSAGRRCGAGGEVCACLSS